MKTFRRNLYTLISMNKKKKSKIHPDFFIIFFLNFIMVMVSRIPAIWLYPQGDLT